MLKHVIKCDGAQGSRARQPLDQWPCNFQASSPIIWIQCLAKGVVSWGIIWIVVSAHMSELTPFVAAQGQTHDFFLEEKPWFIANLDSK